MFQDKKTALANITVNQFANKMRTLNITYDYAVAVVK